MNGNSARNRLMEVIANLSSIRGAEQTRLQSPLPRNSAPAARYDVDTLVSREAQRNTSATPSPFSENAGESLDLMDRSTTISEMATSRLDTARERDISRTEMLFRQYAFAPRSDTPSSSQRAFPSYQRDSLSPFQNADSLYAPESYGINPMEPPTRLQTVLERIPSTSGIAQRVGVMHGTGTESPITDEQDRHPFGDSRAILIEQNSIPLAFQWNSHLDASRLPG